MCVCDVVLVRIQELNNLGELSPHWDNLRRDVIARYSHLIKTYQDTLAELEKFTGEDEDTLRARTHTHRHMSI